MIECSFRYKEETSYSLPRRYFIGLLQWSNDHPLIISKLEKNFESFNLSNMMFVVNFYTKYR